MPASPLIKATRPWPTATTLVQQIVQREQEGIALEKFHRHLATSSPQALPMLVRAMSLARPHKQNKMYGLRLQHEGARREDFTADLWGFTTQREEE